MPISLKEVVDALEMVDDEFSCWLNPETGEIRQISSEEMRIVKDEEPVDDLPDWQREGLQRVREVAESDKWLELPSKFDIHDWEIMKHFSQSRDEEDVRVQLLDAVHGSGAFRNFNSTIRRLGIEDAWYRFRDEALERIASEWLEAEGLAYE